MSGGEEAQVESQNEAGSGCADAGKAEQAAVGDEKESTGPGAQGTDENSGRVEVSPKKIKTRDEERDLDESASKDTKAEEKEPGDGKDEKIQTSEEEKRPKKPYKDISVHYSPRAKRGGGPCGEDAYTYADLSDDTLLMVIADGVGQWAQDGIDPSFFSNGFVECVKEECVERQKEGKLPVLLEYVIKPGLERLLEKNKSGEKRAFGSSTLCVATIKDNILSVGNLGDSGCFVVRDRRMVFRTKPQQLGYNCPYQYCINPSGEIDANCDLKAIPESSAFALQEGDIVVMATDGLFDNVFDEDIVKTMCEDKCIGNPKEIAARLTYLADARAWSFCRTPIAEERRKRGLYGYSTEYNGKPDDITIIVCKV